MTELKGGIIGSTATADLNRLTTGTFRASAINNFETYSATSFNFGFGFGNIGFNSNTGSTTSNGTGISIPGFGTFTFTFPSYFYASGGQASVSNSAVSPASVIIGSGEAASYAALGALSRDTSTSSVLTRQFTEARRAEIAQGFDAARQLVSEVTVFFANRAKEEKIKRDSAKIKADDINTQTGGGILVGSDGKPIRNSETGQILLRPGYTATAAVSLLLSDEATLTKDADQVQRDYGAKSTARILATALTGAAGANVTGSLASFAQAAAVNVLQSFATTRVKSIADSFFTPSGSPTVESEAVRTALQSIVGCAGAAPTGNCASGALGAASSVILNNLVTALSTPEPRDASGNIIPRSLADQQARTALIATLTGAIAAALDLNAGAASTAAQIETENNYLARQQLAARDREYANCNNSTACQLEVFARYTGISVGQDALVIGAIPFGAGEQIFADLSGLYEAVRHPVETYQAIRALATDPLVRAQLGASVLADIDLKLAVLNRALEVGGPANSIAAGKVFGSVAITVAGAVTGAYGAVGATGKLLSIGVKLTRAAVDTVDATLAARAAANAAKAASNFRPLATFSEGLQSAGNYIRAPEISIPYGFPISAQGAALEAAVAQTGVYGAFLGNSAKTFDFFVSNNGLATSTKTINTLTDVKLATARQVEDAAKKAINAALNYSARGAGFVNDIPNGQIISKQVVIAVPIGTTPAQLTALSRAVDYGRLNKIVVKIVITGR